VQNTSFAGFPCFAVKAGSLLFRHNVPPHMEARVSSMAFSEQSRHLLPI
jgi:hypothetical protein